MLLFAMNALSFVLQGVRRMGMQQAKRERRNCVVQMYRLSVCTSTIAVVPHTENVFLRSDG